MRKNMVNHESNGYRVIVVDDEQGIVDSLSIFLKRSGYDFTGLTNPLEAIERVRHEHFDMMILDFMMDPIHGDEVVEEIRKFNKDLYILLLTGHKDLAPPLETIKRLDIQGYCAPRLECNGVISAHHNLHYGSRPVGIRGVAQLRVIRGGRPCAGLCV